MKHDSRRDTVGPNQVILVTSLVLLFQITVWNGLAQNSFVNFEAKQTRPVSLSPDGSRLFAVNTADARLSVFDVSNPLNPILIAEIPVGLEPVSVMPRNNDEAWVVCELSDTIAVVSVSRHLVDHTIQVDDEPADVVFANGHAFVTASRANKIVVIDPDNYTIQTTIDVFGENPRALAVSADETRVYALFALSGNRTTILPPDDAPAQPAPTNTDLPDPPQVGLIIDAADPTWTTGPQAPIQYAMPDNDLVIINTSSLAIDRYVSRIGTVNFSLTVHPNSGDLWVVNNDARNLVRFEPAIRGNFVSNRVSRIQLGSDSIVHFDLNPGFTYQAMPNDNERSSAVAQPTAIVFNTNGNNAFIASFGTDRVVEINDAGDVLNQIELNPEAIGAAVNPRSKRGSRGLALKPGHALYVLNRLANTLSVVRLSDQTVVRELAVGSFDPTPGFVREGRGFLYDAKLSGAGTVSCASCHIDSEMDLIAWDLGDPGGVLQTNETTLAPGLPTLTSVFHPMKGPMTTQTLRGLQNVDPLHWRGDRETFLNFNGAFDSLLGGDRLSGADMQTYKDFIETIVFHPNPNQNRDRSFPTAFPTKNGSGDAAEGRRVYVEDEYVGGLTCNTCHALPTGTAGVIIPAAALQESQDFKIPQLRNVYKKLNVNFDRNAESVGGFGLIHDGIDPDLFSFLSRPVFGVFSDDTERKRNLDAFVQCFDTGTAPAVGFSRTVNGSNSGDATLQADWTLLENQALVQTNIDLVAKGSIDGELRGLVYDPASQEYQSDKTGVGPFTRAQLMTGISNGDSLTLMGVPPGTGHRIGVDRDDDGTLDGDEPVPTLRMVRANGGVLISWPTNAAGFVLERAEQLPDGPWVPETSLRGIDGSDFVVTNQVSSASLFLRLRSL